MKLLAKLISRLEVDKLLHSYVSTILTMLLFALTGNVIISAIIAMAIGIGKELYDNKTWGIFDFKDLVADLIGIIIALVIIILL